MSKTPDPIGHHPRDHDLRVVRREPAHQGRDRAPQALRIDDQDDRNPPTSCKVSGRACVLIFTWGIPEIPVDVHVHRVGGRLGLFPERASFEKAHDEMLAIVPPEDAYELHMNLINHGRQTCRPKPRCGECALRRMCPWYRAVRK